MKHEAISHLMQLEELDDDVIDEVNTPTATRGEKEDDGPSPWKNGEEINFPMTKLYFSICVEINHFIFYIDLSSFLIKTTIHHYLL